MYCICQWLFGFEDSDVAVKFIVYVVLLGQERSSMSPDLLFFVLFYVASNVLMLPIIII